MMPAKDRPDSFPELVSNMVGNAYSVYNFGPWVLALFATYGRFVGVDNSNHSGTDVDSAEQDSCSTGSE
eukprot:6892863-Lingulodinium_polyedra.AAC.1